jgi:hypothetical protein
MQMVEVSVLRVHSPVLGPVGMGGCKGFDAYLPVFLVDMLHVNGGGFST